MATYRNLLCMSRFSTQSSQTDNKKTGRNGKNVKHHKLSKNVSRMTQETTPLMFDIRSLEITPCFSRKVDINNLLRLYSNRSTRKSKVHLRPSKGGETQRAKHLTRGWPSSDHFEFPPRDAQEEKMSQIKKDVLRAIKKMVEENRVIRLRLHSLRQSSQSK